MSTFQVTGHNISFCTYPHQTFQKHNQNNIIVHDALVLVYFYITMTYTKSQQRAAIRTCIWSEQNVLSSPVIINEAAVFNFYILQITCYVFYC